MPACSRLRPVLAALSAIFLLAPLATAQAPAFSAPRTSFGHPSLEGLWGANFILPVEAPPNMPNLTTDEAGSQAAKKAMIAQLSAIPAIGELDPEVIPGLEASDGLAIVRGERRTRAVIVPADGRIPYTPQARGQSMSGFFSLGPMENPEQRPTMERCLTGFAIPPLAAPGNALLRIVQTPEHVVLHSEYNNDLRIVPFTDKHKAPMFRTWLGDSIARWEGDTLVVETINLPKNDRVRLFPPMLVPETSKVTERLTIIGDGELLYQYTIQDPSAFTAPWLAEYSLYSTDDMSYEFACHEGNYSLPNILRAERIKEERTAKAAVAKSAAKPKTP
jgi:hypothetical protein